MEQIVIKLPPGKLRINDARCPNNCQLINPHKLLSDKPAITINARLRGIASPIHFNSYYGLFEYETKLELYAGDVVDLYCPHCGVSLAVDELCAFCRVSMFAIQLPNGGEMHACPLIGCHHHRLTIVDLDAKLAEYYNEERRPKM